ncbi:MAG: ATP-grasp domain-containing protein [Rhizobiales bacterium]|nr:ATP-grasp domain-containing protein [Hyphomicrobiales bacterium]
MIKLETVTIIPFSHQISGTTPNIDGYSIVYGSSGLLKVAHAENWFPAGWDGVNFQIDVAHNHLGKMMLNHAAIKTKWSEAYKVALAKEWQNIFIRPISETKEFPGQTFSLNNLYVWINKLKNTDYFIENDNDAIIGPVLNIGREWRIFIIDGEQVTMCQYANRGQSDRIAQCPEAVLNFLKQALKIYQPASCFVVDVAEVFINNTIELKIIEFNSINSAGFYACGIDVIVDRLSKFAIKSFS